MGKIPEIPDNKSSQQTKNVYGKLAAIGGGSSLISCTCAIVPIVLIAVSSSVAALAAKALGSFDIFFIVLGVSVFVGLLVFDLRRKKSLNVNGVKKLAGPIAISTALFVAITSVLLFAIAPAFMGQLHYSQH